MFREVNRKWIMNFKPSISSTFIVQGDIDEQMEDVSGFIDWQEKGGEVCIHNHIKHVCSISCSVLACSL